MFLLVIPLIVKLISDMKSPELSFWNKMKSLLTFQYQVILILYINTLVSLFCSLLDVGIDVIFVNVRIYLNAIGTGFFINSALKLIAVFALIIHWFYVIRIMDSFDTGRDPNFFRYYALYVLLIVVFVFFAIIGLILYGLYRFVDKYKRITWIYFMGVDILLMIIVCNVCIIVLFVLSILMLIKLSKVENGSDSFLEFAIQLRVIFDTLILVY